MADLNDPLYRGRQDPGTTSQTLLQKLRQGNAAGWEDMVRRYYPWTYGRALAWFSRKGWPLCDVPDVVQEVFLAVKKGLPNFRRERSSDTFRGWIWGIAKHKLSDYARTHYREEALVEELVAADEQTAEELNATAHLVRRVLEIIRPEFNDQDWQAFWRVTVDGKAPDEVANGLQTTRNVVYKAKSRALRRLREELGDL